MCDALGRDIKSEGPWLISSALVLVHQVRHWFASFKLALTQLAVYPV